MFLDKLYIQNQLETGSTFYKEALLAMGKFEKRKGIKDVQHWDREHLFYNPLFTTRNEKTLTLTTYCEKKNIYNLEQLLEEKVKESRNLPFDKVLTNMLNKILLSTSVRKDDILISHKGKEIKFTQVTQKLLYEEALLSIGRDHHSQVKWVEKLNIPINWDEVWNAVNNMLSTNQAKNTIWQQIHLNFYTQYSYNKWHKSQHMCPLCQRMPESIYHLILHCEFTNKLWEEIEPILKELHPVPVSEEEKAFGIVQKKQTTGILLRNWLTYLLRQIISHAEREAHYAQGANQEKIRKKFNQAMGSEIFIKSFRYKNENNLALFDKIITHEAVLCKKEEDGEYQIRDVFS